MNLHESKKLILYRVQNGWVMSTDESFIHNGRWYAFESTESLAEQLVGILGRSGWRVTAEPKLEFQPSIISVPQEVDLSREKKRARDRAYRERKKAEILEK